jgi:hypothetical protein
MNQLLRRRLSFVTALCGLFALSPRPEAILVLDETSFGTAVHFSQSPAMCCAGLPSVAIIQDGIGITSDIQVGLEA